MKKPKLPKTDSIQKLADFWDTHDLTDFEDELEEVAEPVFVRDTAIKVHLESREAAAVQQLAQAKGVSQEELIRAWVLQQLARTSG
jgi:predicted DNA binding CopG/RHH family protein